MLHGKVNLTSSDGLTSMAQVGSIFESNGVTWMYCQATAAPIPAYSVCSVTLAGGPAAVSTATTATTTALGTGGGFACIPQFDVAASEYFWGVIGSVTGKLWDDSTTTKVLATNATAGAQPYSMGTAGVLDDDSAGSTIPLIGLTLLSTATTQAATPFKTGTKLLSWAK
jgi:hypothetical protein